MIKRTNRREFLSNVSACAGYFRVPARNPELPSGSQGSKLPIAIDCGRQLFVDDFLIESCNLERTIHTATLHDGPVLKPETPLELNNGFRPVACPFDDGVFYDPKNRLFKMWYHAGWFDGSAYATSVDGLHWQRPDLDIVRGTNRVLAPRAGYRRDGATVWLDHETDDPAERFKMFVYFRTQEWEGGRIFTSSDGYHWQPRGSTGACGDNTCFYYDPFRKKWVYSIRAYKQGVRVRKYWAHTEFVRGFSWRENDPVDWLQADQFDLPDPTLGYAPQLYKFSAVAYESLMVGLFAIFKGPPNEIASKGGLPKTIDLTVGFSRDGYLWNRPSHDSFLACSRAPGTWNRGYLHSAGGLCLVVGDKLHFYFGTFSGISPKAGGDIYAGASTGLATLRRDGFVSLDAGSRPGTVVSRSVVFKGRYLFVNVDSKMGDLRVEALDEQNRVISPFSARNCLPVSADSTRHVINWNHGSDLSALAGKRIKFRFHLTSGCLYSFWVTPDKNGASNGYVGAGGPGFAGSRDTSGGSL